MAGKAQKKRQISVAVSKAQPVSQAWQEMRVLAKQTRSEVTGIIGDAAAKIAAHPETSSLTQKKAFSAMAQKYLELAQKLKAKHEKAADDRINATADATANSIQSDPSPPPKKPAYAPWNGKKPYKTKLTAREKTTALNGHNIARYCAVLTQNMNASQKKSLRKAVLDATAYAQAANMTNRELQQLIAKKWSEYAGTTEDKFTDRSGRMWRDDVYIQMLVRTNLAALTRAQQVKTLVENGRDLARISAESSDSCDACSTWGGKIVSLTGATKGYPKLSDAKAAGVFHPNCTHRLEVVTQAEIDVEKANIQQPQTKPAAQPQTKPATKTAKPATQAQTAKQKVQTQTVAPDPAEGLPETLEKDTLENAIKNGKALGGSTGAKLVEINGAKFVCKTADASETQKAEHIRSEVATDNAKRALGLAVPECKTYTVAGKTVKLSEYIDGAQTLGDWWKTASNAEKQKMSATLSAEADVDAILADWDGIGLAADNILVKNGVPWHVDNGGAMGFRAQGAKKIEWQNGGFPDELFTIPGSSNNKQYIGNTRPLELIRQTGKRDWTKAINTLGGSDRDIVEKRVKEAKELAERANRFTRDGYTDDETERVAFHCLGLAKDGFRDECPKKVIPGVLPDGSDGDYGNCRTDAKQTKRAGKYTSLPMHVKAYIDANGGYYDGLIDQFKKQGIESWKMLPCLTKIVEMEARGIDPDPAHDPGLGSHGWTPAQEGSYKAAWDIWCNYSAPQRQISRETQAAYKAAFQLFLENTDFEGNDRQNREVILFRTESDIDDIKGLIPGGKYTPKQVGTAESYSIKQSAVVKGHNGTIMRVPYSRILAGYFWEPGAGMKDLFLKEEENEFNADTTGIERVFVGYVNGKVPVAQHYKIVGYRP